MSRARPFLLTFACLPLAGLLLAAAPGAVTPAQADGGTAVRKHVRYHGARKPRVLVVRVPVSRAVPAEKRYEAYSGDPGPCADPNVLSTIQGRFAYKEASYWNSTLEIVTFDRIRQSAFRPWSVSHIPRRYCEARVMTNDNVYRTASYNVGEKLGFAGYGDGVEFCVTGTDRNYAYAPDCKMARP